MRFYSFFYNEFIDEKEDIQIQEFINDFCGGLLSDTLECEIDLIEYEEIFDECFVDSKYPY